MNIRTEKAFKDADETARHLGDMKHSIYEVKIAGGMSEKARLESLLGFIDQAKELLQGMADSIGEAIYELDKSKAETERENKTSGNICLFCHSIGTHQTWCKSVQKVGGES